ncbi:MAG: YcgN family cysteine cluster protein [Candidatus Competibacteraceae bacterium]|jgi:uncharacterized cysteine cluster protein YcgN (CxxCxxCC family)|nr:YcgN family cysteine cluster protein [Candidatus Competibacteraceae bacterium]
MNKFWQTRSLAEMSQAQWESLCDGCGKCCLHKLEDNVTGELFYTNAACRLLDLNTGRCTNYVARFRLVPDCVQLSPATIKQFAWLPSTCAYRLLAEAKELPDWHPLVSGNPGSVKRAGMSVSGWTVSEQHAPDLEQHILTKTL